MLSFRLPDPAVPFVAGLFVALMVATSAIAGGCASGTSAGGSAGVSSGASGTEYYYGTSSTTSPDGKLAYGPPVMTLVRREVSPSEGRIVETATRDGKTLVTTLSHEEAGVFAAQSSDNSFGGAVEFEGSDWQWSEWRYALELTDGSGIIQGTGRIDGKWLETDRYLVSGKGERRSRTTDRLAKITQEEYDRRMVEMGKTAPAGKRR